MVPIVLGLIPLLFLILTISVRPVPSRRRIRADNRTT
jgi:hypothetical protein